MSVIKSIVERASEERIDGGNQPKLSRLPKEGRKKGGFGLVCFWAEKRKKENGRAREYYRVGRRSEQISREVNGLV